MVDKEREDLFIGKKPVMTYVIALLSYNKKARILSRGQNISKSIDVLEVFKRKYAKNVKYEIRTDTVELENRPVSEMQINLTWE
jgi:DNA-binding protein Alba